MLRPTALKPTARSRGSALQCVAVCCSTLQGSAVCSIVLEYAAVCCSVLQCAAVCCSMLQHVAACCSVLQCAVVCCSVLQRAAACCIALQCAALCCGGLHCAAVCCIVLQWVAVGCGVVQCCAVCVAMCCRYLKRSSEVWSQSSTHVDGPGHIVNESCTAYHDQFIIHSHLRSCHTSERAYSHE